MAVKKNKKPIEKNNRDEEKLFAFLATFLSIIGFMSVSISKSGKERNFADIKRAASTSSPIFFSFSSKTLSNSSMTFSLSGLKSSLFSSVNSSLISS